jgi:hypothetical protein
MIDFKTIEAPYVSKKQIEDIKKQLLAEGYDIPNYEFYQPHVKYINPNHDGMFWCSYSDFIKMKYEQKQKIYAKQFVFDGIRKKTTNTN